MAFVVTYEVGILQLECELPKLHWHINDVYRNVKTSNCLVVGLSKYCGDVCALYSGTELECWQYVAQMLTLDLDCGQSYTTYEIWKIEDDSDLWQAWDHDVADSKFMAKYSVPAELACSKGYAEVGKAWVWDDYRGGEGEECAIFVNLQTEPYQYIVDSTLYGVSELVVDTGSDGVPYFRIGKVLADDYC